MNQIFNKGLKIASRFEGTEKSQPAVKTFLFVHWRSERKYKEYDCASPHPQQKLLCSLLQDA